MKRTANKSSREVDNGGGSPGSEDGGSSSSPGTGNGGGSGIDAFLQRLDDDADLKKIRAGKKGIRKAGGDARKSSDVQGEESSSTAAAHQHRQQQPSSSSSSSSSLPKRIVTSVLSLVVLGLIYDTMTSPPDKRILGSHRIHDFLLWVKENPGTGAAAFILVYGMCVVFLLPGTPLTLGGGYVYKLAYGWAGGVAMATFTSMAGSLFGSVSCFVLGRYIMRNQVRRWGRKYPLFDAIDVAVSDNGFKIMCLLYLTPILPLGPVSYMCGTTSMPLVKFAAAKIAALPLMLLYVFIGASTDTFFSSGAESHGDGDGGGDGSVKKMGVDEETHRKMVLFGLVLSIVSMSLVSHFVKKELYKIFDKQKKTKGEKDGYSSGGANEGEHLEMSARAGSDGGEVRRRGTYERDFGDEEKG